MKNEETLNDQVKREELVSSFSRHAKLSNKYMFGILFCCVVFSMNINPVDKVNMPFIGEIQAEHYYLVSMSLISCLIILFSSSHLMAMRIREYYNKYYEGANNKDYFDLIVEPTIFRVAPISWMIKNKNVFYINKNEGHQTWKKIEIITYLTLKGLIFIVVYLFPILILIITVFQSGIYDFCNSTNIILRIVLIILSILSIFSYIIVWKNSFIFTFRVPRNALK